MGDPRERHLAWHETLELHELTAMQANTLIAMKIHMANVRDPALRELYAEAARGTEQNLRELLPYYQAAPAASGMRAETAPQSRADMTAFYAGHLLGYTKTAVRNYAIAITETATPSLRDTFQRHLLREIQMHAKVFNYMLERGQYSAYNLDRLLANDVKTAQAALSM